MRSSRIKEPGLSARIEEAEIAWLRYVTPITEHYCRQISQRDYRGKKLACWMHIRFNTLPMMLALAESGAEIVYGVCNVDSTDDTAAAYSVRTGHHGLRLAWHDPGRLRPTQATCARLRRRLPM